MKKRAKSSRAGKLMMPFRALISYLEDESRPFYYYILTFLAAVTLRNLLEFMVSASSLQALWHHPVHFTLFYASLALSVILLLRCFCGESVPRIARAVMTAFCITPIVPIVDVLLQSVWSYRIQYQYLVPERIHDVWAVFFSFLGGYDGVPPAMRLEIFLATVAGGFYIFYKKSSLSRAILAGAALYSMIFWVYGAILYWVLGVEKALGFASDTTPRTMIDVYLLLSLVAFLFLLLLYRSGHFKEILKDSRLSRTVHYELMVVIGVVLAYPWKAGLFQSLADCLELIFLLASVVFACVFSAITNNMEDIRIDAISNPRRPSVSGAIPVQVYRFIAWMALFLSIVLGLAAGYLELFLVCCFIGGYAIYSLPPIRMKRLPFFSKAIIAINSLIMILCGYSLAGREINTLEPRFVLFFLFALTACANFIDIKDLAGDKAAGIRTLPVLMGPRWSKLLIGSFFLITYAMFPLMFGMEAILVYAILLGFLLFVAMNRGSYSETPVFTLYLLSLVLLLSYVYFTGWVHLDGLRMAIPVP